MAGERSKVAAGKGAEGLQQRGSQEDRGTKRGGKQDDGVVALCGAEKRSEEKTVRDEEKRDKRVHAFAVS